MLHIVVDTNVLGVERPFATYAFLRAVDECREERLRLVVPEIVIREALNLWRRAVASHDHDLFIARRSLRRIGIDMGADPGPVDVGREARTFEESIRATFDEAGVLVPPLPSVSHDAIVERALDRRQPFDLKGRDGYRDVLVWETVLELLRVGHQILLVSADRRAFTAGRKPNGMLAPDLVQEAERAAGRTDAVSLAHDLAAALEELDTSDRTIRDHTQAVVDDEGFQQKFFELLWQELYDLRVDRSQLIMLGLPSSLLEGRISADGWWESDLDEFRVVYGRVISDDEVLLEIKLIELESLDVRFAGEAYETVTSTVDLGDADLDEDAGYLRGTIRARCAIRVDVVLATGGLPLAELDAEGVELADIEITSVEVIDLAK